MTGKASGNIDGYKMSNYRDIREFCIVATAPSNIARESIKHQIPKVDQIYSNDWATEDWSALSAIKSHYAIRSPQRHKLSIKNLITWKRGQHQTTCDSSSLIFYLCIFKHVRLDYTMRSKTILKDPFVKNILSSTDLMSFGFIVD